MMTYIHERFDWPKFRWNDEKLATHLAAVRYHQGLLIGKMEALSFSLREEAVLQSLTAEVLKSSEIEGEMLDKEQVRSCIVRRLGMSKRALTFVDRNVEGVVEVVLDATQNYKSRLTKERLFNWHESLFAMGRSSMHRIIIGHWRDDKSGPMQVISGHLGRERIHYEAPIAKRISGEMKAFLKWFNDDKIVEPILKAAIAHLWFVTIHPFDDGNGRIARAIADMALVRSEQSPRRFYSMSAQIRAERKGYYEILEATQKGGLDITLWLEWFLGCLGRAFSGAEKSLSIILHKARFWEEHADEQLNNRQRKVLDRLLNGFEGKLTSSKWAVIAKCSQDTASRDINDLVERKILMKDAAGGRSTSYSLRQIG